MHCGNWVEYQGKRVRIMAVKYEALGEHIQELMDFLECTRPFEVRPRKSKYDDQPPEIQAGLDKGRFLQAEKIPPLAKPAFRFGKERPA